MINNNDNNKLIVLILIDKVVKKTITLKKGVAESINQSTVLPNNVLSSLFRDGSREGVQGLHPPPPLR